MNITRCPWAKDPYSQQYHDQEWGKPCHNDQKLFELLILEGFQAGLSWVTILKKRAAFQTAFDHFDPKLIGRYDPQKIDALMQDPGIVRNRLKIDATKANAIAFLQVQQEWGSFDRYIWSFTNGKTVDPQWESSSEIPTETALSQKISQDLKKKGFRFVGPTIIYSYLGAIGIVNDHLVSCSFH